MRSRDSEFYPMDINDHGIVVGENERGAAIWIIESGMKNLIDLIPAKSGWTDITQNGLIFDDGIYRGAHIDAFG